MLIIDLNLNKIKIVKQIKWLIAEIFLPFLKLERIFYNKLNKNKKIKRRLFATTGNISLVNILAILEQIDNENYEDYLVIQGGTADINFYNHNIEIAQKHKFKKIIPIANINFQTGFILSNLYYFDEVFVVNHPSQLNILLKLFKDIPINLIDEGCGSLINYNLERIKNLKHFYTNKYIDKIDGLGFSDKLFNKFVTIKRENFNQISLDVTKKYPITPTIDTKQKNILYCAIHWKASGLSKQKFVEEQLKLVNDLLDAGYHILYKAHPRDNEFYGLENNKNVTFVNSVLPAELYNWEVLASVSISSSTSIMLAHYWQLPCFSHVINEAINKKDGEAQLNICRKFIKEYSPDYQLLLNLNIENISRNELKNQIKNLYDKFIESKPLLSMNKEVKQYAELFKN